MKQWYYTQAGERKGPVDAATVQNLYQSGQLKAEDLVWEEGMADWVKADTVLTPNTQSSSQEAPFAASPVPPASSIPSPFPSAAKKDSTLAIVTLVSGIISIPCIFCCGLLGIVPIITGHLALSEFKKNPTLSGKGMAQAGLIMGYFTLVVYILIMIGYFIMVGMAGLGQNFKH
jgi:hypothetical protein